MRNNPRVQISVCDVGPRDGLQNDKVTLEPAVRAELCTRIAATGVKRIEAASFVHPKLVPQMAGAEEVFAALPADDGVAYSSLVLNRKGLDRALATSTTEIHVAYPITDTFAQRNQNTTVEAAARTAEEIIGATELKVTATISVAFGCPFEGHVDPGLVIEHAHRMAAAGADEVILADTIGVAVPRQVRELRAACAAKAESRSACTCTTRATRATRTRSPGSSTARRSSTRASAASAGARSRRARRATSPPRTCSICSRTRASRRGSTSTR